MKTMQALGYKPPVLIADNAGFSDASFLKTVGNISQGAINRSAWDIGRRDSTTFRINEMFKKKTGNDLDDASARAMQGFFVLVDAVNRAGSTEPAKIQAALKATDLKPNQLMIGYKGVKFDEKGNNTLASALLTQNQGEGYVAVWPKESANSAAQSAVQGLVRTGRATTLARLFPLFRHVGNPHCLVTRLSLSNDIRHIVTGDGLYVISPSLG